MNNSAAHTALVRSALEDLAINGYTAWQNQTGVWFEKNDNDPTKKGRPHKYGKAGSADIFLILPVTIHGVVIGVHIEAEAKTGNAKQSVNQKKHQKYVVERNGGVYFVFRTTAELLNQLAAIKQYFHNLDL